MHIQLRDWADCLICAPLSAHTLGKIANGLCDDTLSCIIRAWHYGHQTSSRKAIILAPAMNTAMWEHPVTSQQLDTLKSFWYCTSSCHTYIVEPQVKVLACGDVGTGAMADINDIVHTVLQYLQ